MAQSSFLWEWTITVLRFTGFWLLLSIPAALLFWALNRLAHPPLEIARRLWEGRPSWPGTTSTLRARLSAAREAIVGDGSARLHLERQHKALHQKLRVERDRLEQRLAELESATTSGSGDELFALLSNFKSDVDRAPRFNTIEDNLEANTIALRKARAELRSFQISAVVIGLINFGLLFLYFDEYFGGELIPFLSSIIEISVGLPLALLFPATEYVLGLIFEKAERTTTGILKFVVIAVLLAMLFGVAVYEYMIFYQLSRQVVEEMVEFGPGGWMHIALSAIGPTLTFAQAFLGYYASRARDTIREYSAIQNLKDEVGAANRFVDGLPARLDRIKTAAGGASRAVEKLAGDLQGRGVALASIGATLEQYRQTIIASLDDVNPTMWSRDPEASLADKQEAARLAWLLAPAFLFAFIVYVLTAVVLLRSARFLGDGLVAPILIALATGVIGLVMGNFLFDRIGITLATGQTHRDVIQPRDPTYRIAAGIVVGLIALFFVGLGAYSNGVFGLLHGLAVSAVFGGLVLAGSYLDHVGRGLEFILRCSVFVLTYLLWEVATLVLLILMLLGAALAWLLQALVRIAAAPLLFLIWVVEQWRTRNRPVTQATQGAAG